MNSTFIDEIKNTLISFLREFYAGHDEFTFSEDPRETKLAVMDRNTYNLENKNPDLSLVVGRGRIQYRRSTLGRRLEWTGDQAKKITSDLLVGSMIVSALSRNGLEAERLAAETFLALEAHEDLLRRNGAFRTVGASMAALGEETRLAADVKPELTEVPVIFDFTKQLSLRKEHDEGQPFGGFSVEVKRTDDES